MVSDEDILNARILVVDDNPKNVELLEKTLSNANYRSVLGITNSRQVLKIFESYQPDIILLDINMPHLDGFGVMQQLKEKYGSYLPILVLTAQQDTQTRLRALNSGAMDFLSKPFNTTEALTRVRNILMVRLLHKEVRDQNVILEQQVALRTEELRITQLEIVRRLGIAAEYKDNETGYHIIRMSRICHVLGRKAGLSDKELELLLNASPMHDIGKIGIPDAILLKPGNLDKKEWKIMQDHTLLGKEILGNHDSDLLETARQIAIGHHEKWDGTGYPHGVKGTKIPLVARISALADVFDALTSIRPYKKAWSVDSAMAEIKRSSGTHFDPDLVKIFVESLDEIEKIKEEYQES